MAEIVVAQRMWQRRDSAANWTAANPILAAGEIGVELGLTTADPQMFKIGNGVTEWTDLAYAGGGGSGGSAWYTGSGAPAGGLGVNGDFYLDGDTGDVYSKAAGAWSITGTNIKGIPGTPGTDGADGIPGPSSSCFPTVTFDGGLSTIAPGSFCDLYIPFGFEILEATLLVDLPGNLVLDVRMDTYGNFPPTSLDSICGGNPPTVTAVLKWQDSTLTGWTTTIPAGSTIRFIVISCTGIKHAHLMLEGSR